MTVTIDASVWVAARYPSEPGNAESASCLLAVLASKEPIVLPWLAWVECVAAVARKTDNDVLAAEAGEALRGIGAIRWVAFDEMDAARAVEVSAAARLRAADSIYVAVAAEHEATLITLDQEERRRCPAPVRCMSPDEWNRSVR